MFDFGAITNDPITIVYWASLNNRICVRYRGRKNVTKTRSTGFQGDVEAARAQAPADMDLQQDLNRLEAFHCGHVIKKGEFVDHLVEDQYNALVVEVSQQTHHIANSGGDPDTIDWVTIFEKVLGTRRGHVRGIDPKPSSVVGTSA
ncbi:unnamed protein product [Lactuca saligna]|uniref:Uncharacterized protein n=1 Tax=Lactuca saligna TaxID=75948 RepID=A0AA35UYG4_LACSI|nr:unnamed protein product [Lactuca saligna]